MRVPERNAEVLRVLAAMPLLDWLELAAVSGMAEVTAHRALRRLGRDGLVGHVRHASALIAPTRRWYVTADGLRCLAREEGTDMERLLLTHPVTAHWQRVLLGRLDAVAVIYRLAATVAAAGPFRFRWYRSIPLDAALLLPDGRTLGVIRQGPPPTGPASHSGSGGSWTPICPGHGLSWRCCPTRRGCCKPGGSWRATPAPCTWPTSKTWLVP